MPPKRIKETEKKKMPSNTIIKIVFIAVIFNFTPLAFSQNADTTLYSVDVDKMPKVKKAWENYIVENAISLKSLNNQIKKKYVNLHRFTLSNEQ